MTKESPDSTDARVERALRTDGGHLSIGRAGFAQKHSGRNVRKREAATGSPPDRRKRRARTSRTRPALPAAPLPRPDGDARRGRCSANPRGKGSR